METTSSKTGVFKQQPLTPEQRAKTDKDLKTLASLTTYSESKGLALLLMGGYAVEMNCGDSITRPHGDMDALLLTPPDYQRGSIPEEVFGLLSQEQTPWKVYVVKEGFAEYREDAQEKEFLDKRRIELYILDLDPRFPIDKRKLKDFHGNEYEFSVMTLEELVADKIKTLVHHFNLIEEERVSKYLREITQTDKSDLKRLISQERFSKDKYVQAFIGHLLVDEAGIPGADAIKQAQKQWDDAMRIIEL